ncbi:MAG: ComEC/Rec2 family competence protein [Nitratireductor sp.]|nr:ComEC/Rec2 family competence protein [Nitratireductor sp.]
MTFDSDGLPDAGEWLPAHVVSYEADAFAPPPLAINDVAGKADRPQVPVPSSFIDAPPDDPATIRNRYPIAPAGALQRWGLRAGLMRFVAGDFLVRQWAMEREQGSLFHFVPVALGAGILLWYAAPAEPSAPVVALTLFALFAVLWRMRTRGAAYRMAMSAALVCAGMLLAGLEIARHRMPVPVSGLTGQITGVVIESDLNRRGSPRYLIRPTAIDGLTAEELPRRIRLSGGKGAAVAMPGETISGLARLSPLPGPYLPGGYDFAYHAWLDGLGLSGFFMGAPVRGDAATATRLSERLLIAQARTRIAIAARIRQALPGEAGDIAVALITGDRSGISEETSESLRRSGLAHILAISGLHMALVTLAVIGSMRLIFAAIPDLADRHAVRKWALAIGLAVATLYLFLSGGAVATQRAWIMLAVMTGASLIDRQAITLRSVALAAAIILVLAPSSLFEPGFQMSFAAVAALVACYGQWTRWRQRIHASDGWHQPGLLRQGASYFAALAATSLIAGLATGFFAAWHFHRAAPLGLVSNLGAMPLVSLLVMPLLLASILLMPYGFEHLALRPAGRAIEGVVAISDRVNAAGFDFETGLLPATSLLLAALGLALLCGFRGWLRASGLVPLTLLAAMLAARPVPREAVPDLLISQDGRAVAVRQGEGLALVHPESGKFASDIWRRAYLPDRDFGQIATPGRCDRDLCIFTVADKTVWLVHDPDLLRAACSGADILLAPRLWFVRCREAAPQWILSRKQLEASGSHALHIDGGTISVESVWPQIESGERRFAWQQRFDNVSRRFPAAPDWPR